MLLEWMPSPECIGQQIDLVFLVDSSGSIGTDNFAIVQQFVIAVLNAMDPSATNIGVIQFTDFPNIVIEMGSTTSKGEIVNKVGAMAYLTGGTRTDLALKMAQTMLLN